MHLQNSEPAKDLAYRQRVPSAVIGKATNFFTTLRSVCNLFQFFSQSYNTVQTMSSRLFEAYSGTTISIYLQTVIWVCFVALATVSTIMRNILKSGHLGLISIALSPVLPLLFCLYMSPSPLIWHFVSFEFLTQEVTHAEY